MIPLHEVDCLVEPEKPDRDDAAEHEHPLRDRCAGPGVPCLEVERARAGLHEVNEHAARGRTAG